MKQTIDKKNVVGIAKGEKWTNNKPTGNEAVLVFVKQKEPVKNLDPDDVIEDYIDGVQTDVVGKTGEIFAKINERMHNKWPNRTYKDSKLDTQKATKSRHRPLIGGISIGHGKITAGTLGGFFVDKNNDIVILSNNHILAATNKGRKNDHIYQPGPLDGNKPNRNRIGVLKDYVKLRNGASQDSATARVTVPYINTINHIGQPTGINTSISVNDKVMKSGRTTKLTHGKVIATHGNFKIWYTSKKAYMIKNCIVTTAMCEGGDSGSLLLDNNKKVAGLLFAGSNEITLHSPIDLIISRYGLKLINKAKAYKLDNDNNIIVDSNDAIIQGKWARSRSVKPFVGKNYLHDKNQKKGAKSAIFNVMIPETGTYDIYLLYSVGRNRASNVPLTITNNKHTDTTIINQQKPQETPIKTLNLDKNDTLSIAISNNNTNGYVIVDAIKLHKQNDNTQNNNEKTSNDLIQDKVKLVGEWKRSKSAKPFIGREYWHDNNSSKGDKFAKFNLIAPEDGEYSIKLLYPQGRNRASNVPVVVYAPKTVTVNQKIMPDHLGILNLKKGDNIVVELSNKATDGYVIADAVELKKI